MTRLRSVSYLSVTRLRKCSISGLETPHVGLIGKTPKHVTTRHGSPSQPFTVWRALRSLERRGLVAHQRYDDGIGDWWWRAPEAGT